MSETSDYHLLILMLPLMLLFFYLSYPQRLMEKKSLVYAFAAIVCFAIAEQLANYDIQMAFMLYNIDVLALCAFAVLISVAFVCAVRFGKSYDYSMLFAFFAIGFGIYYASDPVALSLFFLTASLIVFCGVVYSLIYQYYFDDLTGLYNYRSYLRQSKHLSPKYSLGIITIDGFDGLSKGLTRRQKNELLILVSDIIQENISDDATLYRYEEASFLVIDEKLSLKEIRDLLEQIRRQIAAAEFILYRHPIGIRITISGGVADKKRVDVNVNVVLTRAIKAMKETLKFSGNVISPILKK